MVHARYRLSERSPAAALYRRDARPRRRAYRSGSAGARPADAAGEPIDLPGLRREQLLRDRFPDRDRQAERMWAASRRQQRPGRVDQSGLGPQGLSRRPPARPGGRDPSGGARARRGREQAAIADRHSRPPGRPGGLGSLRACHRPDRPDGDPDRVGQRCPRLAHAERGSGTGRGDHGSHVRTKPGHSQRRASTRWPRSRA